MNLIRNRKFLSKITQNFIQIREKNRQTEIAQNRHVSTLNQFESEIFKPVINNPDINTIIVTYSRTMFLIPILSFYIKMYVHIHFKILNYLVVCSIKKYSGFFFSFFKFWVLKPDPKETKFHRYRSETENK